MVCWSWRSLNNRKKAFAGTRSGLHGEAYSFLAGLKGTEGFRGQRAALVACTPRDDGGNVYIRNTRSSQISQEQRLRELVAEGLEKSNKVKFGDGYLVRIPEIKGRICRIKRGSSTYVEYIYDRRYDPETKQSRNK